MKKKLRSLFLVNFFVFASALVAHAVPLTLTIDDLSTALVNDVVITNNSGLINFSNAVGDFSVVVATGVSEPVVGSLALPELHLNSLQVSGANAGALSIALTSTWDGNALDPSFNGVFFRYNAFAAGVMDINATVTAPGPSGTILADFTAAPTFSGLATFEAGQLFPFIPDGPFNMTIRAFVSHNGDTFQTSNFGASLTPVPEPATLVLLGSSLFGLAYRKRRK